MTRLIIPAKESSLITGVRWRPNRPVFYCDESGRSGPNYLDPSQPVHVLAGFVVPEHWHSKVDRFLAPIREELAPTEPKSDRMLKLPRRQLLLSDFMVRMHREFFAIVIVVHKRYYAGMRLLNFFLDPSASTSARWLRRTAEVAQEVAEICSTLSDDVLRKLRKALANPCRESMVPCIDAAESELRNYGYSELARFFRRARREIHSIVAAAQSDVDVWEFRRPTGEVVRAGASLDLDAFIWCMNRVDLLLRSFTHAETSVVCDMVDESVAFERAFGVGKASGSLEKLSSLQFRDSRHETGLQAADLLAGLVRRFVEDGRVPNNLRSGVDAVLSNWFTSSQQAQFFGPRDFVNSMRIARADLWRREFQQRERLVALLRTRHSSV